MKLSKKNLKGIQRKYASDLDVKIVSSIAIFAVGVVALILYFTIFRGVNDVLVFAIELIILGFGAGAIFLLTRYNSKMLKEQATKEYDERNIKLRRDTIRLSFFLTVIIMIIVGVVMIFVEPGVSVLLILILLSIGVIYLISATIVYLFNRTKGNE